MDKLIILQVCPHYVPAYHFGGALQVAHSLNKSLISQDQKVIVCTTNLLNHTQDLAKPLDKAQNIEGVIVYYEPVIFFRRWGFSIKLAKRVFLEAKKADLVIINFHYQFSSFISGIICRLIKKPYVYVAHGSINKYGIEQKNSIIKKFYLILFEKRNMKSALFVGYHSREEKENSYQFGKSKIIPNGIDPEMFSALPEKGIFKNTHINLSGKLIFLYLGRLDPGKGLDLLINAFKIFSLEIEDIHLLLVGGDEHGYGIQLMKMVEGYGMSDCVTFTGLLSGQQKLAAIQDSDVFVLPSRSEGTSVAMLEAMYMGLPVIVSDRVGLFNEIEIEKCGIVAKLNLEELVEAMRSMINASLRKKMGENGNSLILRKYTWDKISRQLIEEIGK